MCTCWSFVPCVQVDALLASGQTSAAAEQAAAAQKADVRIAAEQQKLQDLRNSLQEPSNVITEAVREHAAVSKELDLCLSLVSCFCRSAGTMLVSIASISVLLF